MANAIVQATTHFDNPEGHRRGEQGPRGGDARDRAGDDPGGRAARGPRLVGTTSTTTVTSDAGARLTMKIGVLAVQGAFVEHVRVLDAIGVEPVEVRLPEDLDGLSGLILPGGESTTMRKLIDRWGLREPIIDLAASGAPLFGTCAGMILLAREIAGGEEPVFPLLDITVERNAFGRQLDSFEGDLAVPILGDGPVHGVFIRAPIVDRVGPDVDVLARLDDGRIVAVRERNVLATAFHPELAGETRFHRLMATMAAEHDDPGEGSGPAAPPDPPRRQARPVSGRSGKVRVARLTDLAALGELSRLCQQETADARSLGLPGERSADRRVQPVPAAARRLPAARPAVRLRGGGRAVRPGPGRARDVARRMDDRRARRDRAGRGRRHPLPPRPAPPARRREARARSASTWPAPTRPATSSCSCRPASPATARSVLLFRPPGSDAARAVVRRAGRRGAGSGPRLPDRRAGARPALRDGHPAAGPAPRGLPARRLGAPGSRLAGAPLEPGPDPALRRRRGVRPGGAGRREGRHRGSTRSSRSAWPRRTSRTTSRSWPGPESDVGAAGGVRSRGDRRPDPQRRPQRPWGDRARFGPTKRRSIGGSRRPASGSSRRVTLLMKETVVRVAEPALVPAIR